MPKSVSLFNEVLWGDNTNLQSVVEQKWSGCSWPKRCGAQIERVCVERGVQDLQFHRMGVRRRSEDDLEWLHLSG